jgi:hypothetical protein
VDVENSKNQKQGRSPVGRAIAPFRAIVRDSTGSFGQSGKILLMLACDPPDPEQALNVGQQLRRMAENHAEGFGVIMIVREASTPAPEVRDVILRAFRDHWDNIRAAMFVVEAQGFRSALQRSIVVAVTMAMQVRSRVRVCKNPKEQVAWFAETLGGTDTHFSGAGLLREIRAFCDAEVDLRDASRRKLEQAG